MIEIVVLYFLTRNIGTLAIQKGEKPLTWKILTIVAWFAGEIVGSIIAMLLLQQTEIFPIILIALGCAASGYFIVRSMLNRKPDALTDDIDQIGKNGL
jgi:hypothetical protein